VKDCGLNISPPPSNNPEKSHVRVHNGVYLVISEVVLLDCHTRTANPAADLQGTIRPKLAVADSESVKEGGTPPCGGGARRNDSRVDVGGVHPCLSV